jgi:hypothetical protein
MSADVIQHVRSYFGPEPTGGIVGRVGDDIELAVVMSGTQPFAVVTTRGLAAKEIAAIAPQEIVCFIRPDQWEAAVALITLTVEGVLERGRGLNPNDVISSSDVLLAETQISGVLAFTNGYFDESFDVVRDDSGAVVAQLITLVPITGSEAAFLNGSENAEEAFFATMSEKNISEVDVTREPAL